MSRPAAPLREHCAGARVPVAPCVFTVPSGSPSRAAISDCVRPLEECQLDHLPLSGREPSSPRSTCPRSSATPAGPPRSPSPAPRTRPRRHERLVSSTYGPQLIDCSTLRPHQEPGLRAAAARVVLRCLPPDLPEHLLQDFLGNAGSRSTRRMRPNATPASAIVETAERLPIPLGRCGRSGWQRPPVRSPSSGMITSISIRLTSTKRVDTRRRGVRPCSQAAPDARIRTVAADVITR